MHGSMHEKYESYDNYYDRYYDDIIAKNLPSTLTDSANYINEFCEQAGWGGDTRFSLLGRSCV